MPERNLPKRVGVLLWIGVGALVLFTAVGIFALRPASSELPASVAVNGPGISMMSGTVTGFGATDGEVDVRVDGETRDYPVQIAPEYLPMIEVGGRVRIMYIPEAIGSGSPYVFVDFERSVPLVALAIVYGLVVVAVARWRGFAAIVGLAIAFAVIFAFVLPALLAGKPALAVALVGSCAIMIIVIYVAHGPTARATVALFGTVAGLLVTAGIAAWAVGATHLTGYHSDASYALPGLAPKLSIQAVLLCGIILAGLGVLNDVTITQSSAVWELRAADPNMSRRVLFRRAMRIGRDHIASTVYTIAFAYAGAALPLLLLLSLYQQSPVDVLTSDEIAEEVVRILVSSIGLVLAIPLTTMIAVLVVGGSIAEEDVVVLGGSIAEEDVVVLGGSIAEEDVVVESVPHVPNAIEARDSGGE